jgi:hypothetical protein
MVVIVTIIVVTMVMLGELGLITVRMTGVINCRLRDRAGARLR